MKQTTRKRPKSSVHKNLTRCEYPSFTGVKLSVMRCGFVFLKFFPVKNETKWEDSELKAIYERDRILRTLEGKSENEIFEFFREYRKASKAKQA